MKQKDIIKCLDKKSNIDILLCVNVHDGIATITDLANTIHFPAADLPDGLYEGKPWSIGHATPSALKVDDYPLIPDKPSGPPLFSIHTDAMPYIIAPISKEIKFNPGGAILEVSCNGNIFWASTDGHRMHTYGVTFPKADTEHSYIISRKTLELLQLSPGSWDVWADEHNLFFVDGQGVMVSSRIIDQVPPNYRAIIPENFLEHKTIPIEPLDALVTVYEFMKKCGEQYKNSAVYLQCVDGKYWTGIENHCKMYQIKTEINCDINGLEVAFNAEYIRDGLKLNPTHALWKANDESLFLIHEKGACVVMPLNL
jgi:DNA polymerase III sliding clamp (beta) subunit (PCNA family)